MDNLYRKLQKAETFMIGCEDLSKKMKDRGYGGHGGVAII